MIAEQLRDRPLARRAAALLLLALVLFALAPVVTGPLGSWREGREAVAAESAVLERIHRLAARRAAVAALAAKPDAPFFTAPDAAAAAEMIAARIEGAAPSGAMRIEGVQRGEADPRPGAPVRLSFGFTATQGALHAFLAEIETRPPYLRVERLVASPIVEENGAITLAGTGAVAAVPLLRPAL